MKRTRLRSSSRQATRRINGCAILLRMMDTFASTGLSLAGPGGLAFLKYFGYTADMLNLQINCLSIQKICPYYFPILEMLHCSSTQYPHVF